MPPPQHNPPIRTRLQLDVMAMSEHPADSAQDAAQPPDEFGRVEIIHREGTPDTASEWLLWQLADSAFPTGGFGHSAGLEAAWQHHEVRGGEALTEYLGIALRQLAHAAMPFVAAAFRTERCYEEVDSWCDAFLSNDVTNRASRAQGQSLLASAEKIFQVTELSGFRTFTQIENLPCHLAPVLGRVASILKLQECATARLFVFMQLRGWISAAVRLNMIGPLEGQRIQHRLGPAADAVAQRFGEVPLEAASQMAPLLDLWQGTQPRLYSRLFQS